MTLASGVKLGPYEILSPLGAGGMGEVYKARDARLNRFVAIKVLPESVARDADALARFEREAHAVAALSHPNILAIHDFGTHDGVAYAVTELLQGETLREMLSGGALPLRKTVDFSRQICAGLAAAHAAGIVHRDLKPDNVFVTNDGRVKILDFGLAKPVVRKGSADETHSPTVSAYTEPGTVMGTVGYMSPEQVKARDVDHRSDIFSFGAVLYEMLTGQRAFQRETAAETMTAVLREDPPEPSATGRPIPAALDRVVRHCLEKRPEQRFQSASDIAFALEETSGAFSGASAASDRVSRFRGTLGIAVIALVLGLAAGAALVTRLRRPAATEPTRIHALTFSGRDNEPAASPDGKLVAFTSWRDGTARVWIKQLAGGGEAPLTAGPDRRPRFSPDGSSVLFVRDLGSSQAIYRVGLIGGDPRKLIDDASEADWSPDGRRVVYLRRLGGPGLTTQIGVLDLESGKDTVLAKLANSIATSLRWSPDGRDIAFTQGQVSNAPTWKLLRIDLASGRVEPLGPGPGNSLGGIAWSGDGRALFYVQSASVMGDISGSGSRVLRLDRRAGRPEPVLWADGLAAINASTGEVSRCDVLSPGRLVFSQRLRRQNLREAVIRAPGQPATTRTITEGSSIDRQPTYSPDGKWMLFSSNRSGNLDLWLMDPASGALRQVTDDRAQDWDPAFTSDGKHILWDSDRTGHLEVWIANVDGSGARQVTHDGVDAENPTETPDGNWVVYWSGNAAKRGVWKVHPDGSGEVQLLETDAVGTDVSPDGRYVLYLKQDRINSINTVRFLEVGSGRPVPFEIPVRFSVGSPGIIWGRGRWSRDGRSIYFVGENAAARSGVFVQDFAPGRDTTATRRPVAGFSPDYVTESLGISPDGSRLVISTGDEFASISIAENVPGAEPPVRKSP
jgi:Tol biopolymer transport system component